MTYTQKIDVAIDMYLGKENQTKKSLASRLGMTPETLANKRSGATEWTFGEVLAISDITGISVSSLAH